MSSRPPPIVLNANQRRHFEVLFGRLDDSLTRIEALLAPDGQLAHVIWIHEQDIPDSYRRSAAPIIALLRQRIHGLAIALELQPRVVSQARAVAATLTAESIRVQDSLSAQLRGYGAVDPSVEQYLDPALREIAQTLGSLASALEHYPHPKLER